MRIRGVGRKGWLPAFRDATLLGVGRPPFTPRKLLPGADEQ